LPSINFLKPIVGIALMLTTLSGAALAETLVVRSSGPSAKSYPPGKALSELPGVHALTDVTGLSRDHYIAFALIYRAQYIVFSGLTSLRAERILVGLS